MEEVLIHNYDGKEFIYDLLRVIADYDISDQGFFRYENGVPEYYINCNDLHWWGVSDCVQVTSQNINILKECLDINEIEGCLLFCCREYELRPQGAYYKHLYEHLWIYFDTCGEYRRVGFFNPEYQKFNNETWQYNLQHFANEIFEDFTYPYINYKGEIIVE